jgi:hypothetical protein
MSEQTEQINELAMALSKAQGKITGALKDSENPFFSSKYADLASCWDSCRAALSENGLCVIQTTKRGEPVMINWETTNQKTGEVTTYNVASHEFIVSTMLAHSSGQWIRTDLALIPRDVTPQGIGAAFTYGRRYGFAAIVGLAQIDDDGNAASGRGADERPAVQRGVDPRPSTSHIDTKVANSYCKKVIEAINAGKARQAADLRAELSEDPALFTVVWGMLAKPLKEKFEDLITEASKS